MLNSDLHIDLEKNSMEVLNNNVEPWKISLVDTGQDSMTGGRIKRIKEYVGNETFFVNSKELNYHPFFNFENVPAIRFEI